MAAEYPTSPDATAFVLRLGSAASIEAGNMAAQHRDRDRAQDIENTVRFILAGIRELVDQPASQLTGNTAWAEFEILPTATA
jgi:hypothetical protein